MDATVLNPSGKSIADLSADIEANEVETRTHGRLIAAIEGLKIDEEGDYTFRLKLSNSEKTEHDRVVRIVAEEGGKDAK